MQGLSTKIVREILTLSYFKRIPRTKLQSFAADIALVSLQLRTGYLFDAFSLVGLHWVKTPSYILADTTRVLRKKLTAFHDVVVLHDDLHDQLFFVNVPLFLKRCHDEFGIDIPGATSGSQTSSSSYTAFVLQDDHPRLLHEIPHGVRRILQTLCPTIQANTTSTYPQELLTIPLSQDTAMVDVVPLAGFILEYPVAYVPVSEDQDTFLPWEVLDVYECTLTGEERERYLICRFSCPNTLSLLYDNLSVDRLRETLTGLISTRLRDAAIDGQIEVRHHQETHERVAL